MYNANFSVMEKLYNSPAPQSVVSQKARGIWWIEQNLQFNSLPSIYLKPKQEITEDLLKSISFPAFVRSCPVNPRPGVIESDIAHQKESFSVIFGLLSHLMSEKHEEMGDIVVQPFIPAVAYHKVFHIGAHYLVYPDMLSIGVDRVAGALVDSRRGSVRHILKV